MKLLIDSVEITTDKKVKLIRYKIDESLIPQSLKKDWGSFFMPKFNFVINVANENRIENLSLLPLFQSDKSGGVLKYFINIYFIYGVQIINQGGHYNDAKQTT